MGLKLYEETSVQAIANAIRAKNGSSDTYTISEMSTAIANIPSGSGEGNTKVVADDIVLVSQNGSTVNWHDDGSVDFTWLGGSGIGFNYVGTIPIKDVKRVLIHMDELGESYQHAYSTEQRNWNFSVGLTNVALPQNSYIDLTDIDNQGKLVTDVEVDVIDNYGKTDLNYVIDLSNYQNQDLYLFILAPGMTIEGLKITLVYDNDYYLGEYEYHWSNDSKICVRKEVGAIKWFFMGLTKQAADINVPEELVSYLPDFEAPGQYMHCIAFAEPNGSWDGSHYIGFVYPGTNNVKIRSWYLTALGGGTFWGVLDITHYPFIAQQNPYVDPTNVSAQAMKVGSKTIATNGVYSAEDDGYTGYSEVTVHVPTVEGVRISGETGYNRITLPHTDSNDDYEYVLKFYNSGYQHNVSILGNSANGYNIQLTEYNNTWYCDGGNNDQLSYTPESSDDFVGHFIFVSNAIDGTIGLSDRDIALFNGSGILLHKFGTKGTSVLTTPEIWLLSRQGTAAAGKGIIERLTIKDKSNNNAIICDYVPAMKAINGVKYSGLYDSINQNFIYKSYVGVISGVAF